MQCSLLLASASLLALGSLSCSSSNSTSRDLGAETTSSTGAGNNSAAANTAAASAVTGGSGSTTGGLVNIEDSTTPETTCGSVLPVILRDFKGAGETGGHPDFELAARNVIQSDGAVYRGWNDVGCGLVEPTLGGDSKPVFYAGAPDVAQGGPSVRRGVGRQKRVVAGAGCWTAENPTPTGICNIGSCVPWDFDPPTYEIESAATFNQWFNTISGINMEVAMDLPLMDDGTGTYVFDSNAFFPLDNAGFGNTPGEQHNYHFTTEAHVLFTYQAGQVFTFRGDDDLWIFVNGKLALDVGGLHQALQGTIAFDAVASQLGISPGGQYQMDIFHAERQTEESNFRIETNISCFEPVDIVK